MADFLEVFLTFLRIGLLSFGGGMANLPEMSRILIANGWVTPQGFADGFALGQFVPGPNMLAVLFYGFGAMGFVGSLAALLGMFLPGALGAALLVRGWELMAKARWSRALRKALVPVGFGLGGSAVLTLVQLGLESWYWLILVATSALLIYRGVSVLLVIAGGALAGVFVAWL